MTSPLEAALLVALLALPLHLLVQWQIGLLSDPGYVRRRGVVIVREEVVRREGEVIGKYLGREIPAQLVFLGMRYRFDRITAPSYRDWVGERELYLEPGLVYVTD